MLHTMYNSTHTCMYMHMQGLKSTGFYIWRGQEPTCVHIFHGDDPPITHTMNTMIKGSQGVFPGKVLLNI